MIKTGCLGGEGIGMVENSVGNKRSGGWRKLVATVVVAFIIVISVGLGNYFFHFQSEILGFFRIGTELPASPYLHGIPRHVLSKGELGYDGQFFLTLALDPSLGHKGSIAALDNPRYRYRRILYPILAYLLAFGRRTAVPYLLVGINAASLTGIVLVLALWFQKSGISPWFGLTGLALVGVWIVFLFSTAGLLGAFLLISALYAYIREKTWIAALAMAAAGLTHETLLLVLAGFWVDALIRKNRKDLFLLTLSVVPALFWNLHVLRILPSPGSTTGILENFTLPASGVIAKIRSLDFISLRVKMLYDSATFFLLSGMLFLLCFAPSPGGRKRVLRWCGVVYLVLYFLVSMQVFEYYLGFNRVFMNVGLLLSMSLVATPWRRLRIGLLTVSAAAAVAFVAAYTAGLI
jgi:hypothetical protein